MIRVAVVGVVAALLVGCSAEAHGNATLWITRDRGARVLLVRTVPAGLTAMQALHRVADVDTRYAGKFVEAIDGLSGSLTKQRDWFYFINGYEADRSAAEYRLHRGDVEWWDFRRWNGAMSVPIVVGAFPEPFLHGWAGRRLPARVVGADEKATRLLARLLHASGGGGRSNVLILRRGPHQRFTASTQGPGKPVTFVYVGDPMRLARNPQLARFRYSLP